MLGDALSYPSNSDDWLKTILIGGVLIMFSWLVLPAFVLYGYYVRVMRSATMDEETPPEFEEWEELLVDGVKSLGIYLGYNIIPTIIYIIGLFVFIADGGTVGLIIFLVSSLPLLVASYIYPVALTNFALTGEFRAAFEIRRVVSAAFTTRYFTAVILAVVVGGILLFISSLFSIILIGLFGIFYVTMSIFYLYARGCAQSLQTRTGDREQTSASGRPSG